MPAEESSDVDESPDDIDKNDNSLVHHLPITNIRNPIFSKDRRAFVTTFQKGGRYDLFFHEMNVRTGINFFAEMVTVRSLQIGKLVLIPNDNLTEFEQVWQLTCFNTFKLISSAIEFPEESMKFIDSDLSVPVANQLYLSGSNLYYTQRDSLCEEIDFW